MARGTDFARFDGVSGESRWQHNFVIEWIAMKPEKVRIGVIQKIVRVPRRSPLEAGRSPIRELQGYGILREANGHDLFFVGSAVTHGDFDSLEAGIKVTYVKVPGPLAEAAEVRICTSTSSEEVDKLEPSDRAVRL